MNNYVSLIVAKKRGDRRVIEKCDTLPKYLEKLTTLGCQ